MKIRRRKLSAEKKAELRQGLELSAKNPHPESEMIANEGHNDWLRQLDEQYGAWHE